MTTTSVDERKQLSRRQLEIWTSNDHDIPEEVLTEKYRNHQEPDADGTEITLDLDGWKARVENIHRAFSDFEVQVFDQVAEGDIVATRWKSTATNTGPFFGHPRTARRATWTGVVFDRFEGGKIARPG